MPLTLPTHPAAVLPLKVWRPRWFDGVALVTGSVAPDLAYALDGSGLPVWPLSHQPAGLVAWCLPAAVAVAWLTRRAAPVLAAHLPAAGDYGVLGSHRPAWPVTVSSALLGAASHLALDRLEFAVPWSEYVMHVLGAAGLAAVVLSIRRGRLLRRWHGDPPPCRRRPLPFWTVACAVTLPPAAITPLLPGASLPHTTGVRLLCAAGAGLLAASWAVSCRS
ncbi:DUF4184 family protein [Dactylosporangium sp. NPDC000521]|uniref:DUF4184 family protein n=1 Tax=Dactylosporangium sp. NPDC000521 TaxID=3363975 RepID=UPI0036A81F0D